MDLNNEEKCVYCKRPIIFDWVCDPDSTDREYPEKYHLGCWFEAQRLLQELQNVK